MASNDIESEIRHQAKKQLDRTIEIPDGLTEDEAVASVTEQCPRRTARRSPATARRRACP